jgi:hypothetical protein
VRQTKTVGCNLALLLSSKLEVLAALDRLLKLDLADSALKTKHDLLGGLGLIVGKGNTK